jgi:hypothetical protein
MNLGPVVDLPTAAALLGIGRTISYALVREDRFPVPVLRVGRLIRVPTAPLLALLGITPHSDSTHRTSDAASTP